MKKGGRKAVERDDDTYLLRQFGIVPIVSRLQTLTHTCEPCGKYGAIIVTLKV